MGKHHLTVEKMTVQEIKDWFHQTSREEILLYLDVIKKDQRASVHKLVKAWENKEAQYQAQLNQWQVMSREEKLLFSKGYQYIVGIDEVGRGPLAGPVVAAAVILPEDFFLLGINDSKKLSASKREELAAIIKKEALAYSVAFVDAKEIDRINIYEATKVAMLKAIQELPLSPSYALIDAMKLPLSIPYQAIIKGDAQSISIAAASIVAKVERDQWMETMSELYPQYGFERNMGYGTKEHVEAIQVHGITPIHRKSFVTNLC
ncbi:ribonuclease HII [Caldalkalibacillus mannanilyticus]|uniref:ribonuclease HII n=1 Tax=Caldalkalibacillus mannanilyticus TaxID=1418 RepID=UPI00046A70BE|nr:ribonuclease HII [Caldalkalibacillus mannanilyticus]